VITESAGLGQAWRAVELALPKDWIIRSLEGDGMTWDAVATPYSDRNQRIEGMGNTPAEALQALALALRADPVPA
jgi:hypothetical protein